MMGACARSIRDAGRGVRLGLAFLSSLCALNSCDGSDAECVRSLPTGWRPIRTSGSLDLYDPRGVDPEFSVVRDPTRAGDLLVLSNSFAHDFRGEVAVVDARSGKIEAHWIGPESPDDWSRAIGHRTIGVPDLDRDGVPDVLTLTQGEELWALSLGTQSVLWRAPLELDHVLASGADLDGDGIADVYAAQWTSGGFDVVVLSGESGTRLRHVRVQPTSSFPHAVQFVRGVDLVVVPGRAGGIFVGVSNDEWRDPSARRPILVLAQIDPDASASSWCSYVILEPSETVLGAHLVTRRGDSANGEVRVITSASAFSLSVQGGVRRGRLARDDWDGAGLETAGRFSDLDGDGIDEFWRKGDSATEPGQPFAIGRRFIVHAGSTGAEIRRLESDRLFSFAVSEPEAAGSPRVYATTLCLQSPVAELAAWAR